MPGPLLSVLIPTYDYAEGLDRILRRLHGCPRDRLEVVVSDDSTTDAVQHVVHEHASSIELLRYVRNKPALGACANWNAMLDEARGEYLLLLHHDEYPASTAAVRTLMDELAGEPADVLILKCLTVRESAARPLRLAHRWLREAVVRKAPSLLYRHNVIGAASNVVARAALYPRFDVRLTWLIDVEMYVSLLRAAARVRFADVEMVSVVRRAGSITTSLGGSLAEVRDRELSLLADEHPNDLVLGWLASEKLTARTARAIEASGWALFRGIDRLTVSVMQRRERA